MNRKTNSLAGLLLAVLVLVIGYAMGVRGAGDWVAIVTAAGFVFGTVTVTYQWPVVGTVAPTVLQMKPLSLVTAAINWGADSDTVALITHNMQLGTVNLPTNNASLVNETACLFPLVGWYYNAGGSLTLAQAMAGSIVSSSVFQITKASGSSSAGTVNVFVMKPYTGIR